MASELSNALDDVARLTRSLNQLTDKATDAVMLIEEFLNNLSVGIQAEVQFGEDAHLCYLQMANRKFHIVVNANLRTIAWPELPREVKLVAITALPELLRQILVELKERVRRAEQALSVVDEILPEIKSRTGGQTSEEL